MRLNDLIPEGAIVVAINSQDRDEVIVKLVEALVAAGVGPAGSGQELAARVLERERKYTTAFGSGVAIPHAKHRAVSGLGVAIGLSTSGIEWNSLDRQPVFSVFLLLSPEAKPEEHLQAMEAIFKNLGKETFRRFLRQAGSVEEVRALLAEADSQSLTG